MTDRLRQVLKRYADAARRLEGWQLEYAPEPMVAGPPWNYEAMARALAAESNALLDLGTGGGEVLARIVDGLGCRAVATEAWSVNAPVAARRLRGRVSVVRASAESLPFASASFDLILSRHEAICPSEVARSLRGGGRLLTQQVVPDLWHELRSVFPDMARFPDHYTEYQAGCSKEGLTIEVAREFRRPVRFRQLGHLVYHLVAAPWTIPGFGVDSHFPELKKLHSQISSGRPLILTEGYYVIQARCSA
jgi:SAM-dependent methyltransferase